MSYFENRLALSCKQLGEASAELLEWIDDNGNLVGAERISLLRDFYRSGQNAQRLASAVNAMACVAVVGPRRCGKTQLASALVERGNAPLSLRFDGIQDTIGYARQIVPEGGRFGASAVIRLSAKSRPAPQNFPISVRLVSFADLIKTIGSAYLKAAPVRSRHQASVVQVRAALQESASRLVNAPVAGLREDDVWDVRDYFASRFTDEPLLGVLAAAGFWEFLAENCSALTNNERARLLSFLWGGLDQFTALFTELAEALTRLGFGREASCALDAILGLDQRTGKFTRRTDSILSAQTLTGLGTPQTDAIVVRTELGQWVSLTRPVMSALIAEVRLPVRGYASELLEKADILELPAIEPREAVPRLGDVLVEDEALAAHLYMKAKGVLLLERYTADSEITSLVLCVDPNTRKLGELPRLVAQWIERTHGADPTEREPNDNGLFVVLTKLDRELTEPVRRGAERRVDIGQRIAGVLLDDLGREHGWPREWTPGRPFDNVHLVRTPAAKLKHFCEYDAQGRETGYRPAVLERVERARLDFLESDTVKAHVSDPGGVWNEALELNDGGITYLAQSIGEVCDMRVKHRQILSSLTGLRQAMKDRLQRYYVSDNQAVQQSRRHGAALLVVRRIRQCADGMRLGPLIRALQMTEAEAADVLVNFAALREHLTGIGDQETPEPTAFARAAVAHWIEQMRTGAGAVNASRRFMIPPAVLASLVDELIVGAARLELEASIAERIEMSAGTETDTERRVAIAAMCAAGAIGEYVMWLGFTDNRSNSRPRRKGKREIQIFPPRPAADLSRLEAGVTESEERFFADWSQAFTMLVAENAADLRERDINADENRRLGQLLMLLDTTI